MIDIEYEQSKREESSKLGDFGMMTTDGINFSVINYDNYHVHNASIVRRSKNVVIRNCDCDDFSRRCMQLGIKCKHLCFIENNAKSYHDNYLDAKKYVLEEVMSWT